MTVCTVGVSQARLVTISENLLYTVIKSCQVVLKGQFVLEPLDTIVGRQPVKWDSPSEGKSSKAGAFSSCYLSRHNTTPCVTRTSEKQPPLLCREGSVESGVDPAVGILRGGGMGGGIQAIVMDNGTSISQAHFYTDTCSCSVI